jgi:hypothetical protein
VTVSPINTWYGKYFGPVARVYQEGDATIVLIRGINFYCQGSHCTNYKVIVIVNRGSEMNVSIIGNPGYYPFNFENTYLIKGLENKPSIYVVKKGKGEVSNKNDMELIELPGWRK